MEDIVSRMVDSVNQQIEEAQKQAIARINERLKLNTEQEIVDLKADKAWIEGQSESGISSKRKSQIKGNLTRHSNAQNATVKAKYDKLIEQAKNANDIEEENRLQQEWNIEKARIEKELQEAQKALNSINEISKKDDKGYNSRLAEAKALENRAKQLYKKAETIRAIPDQKSREKVVTEINIDLQKIFDYVPQAQGSKVPVNTVPQVGITITTPKTSSKASSKRAQRRKQAKKDAQSIAKKNKTSVEDIRKEWKKGKVGWDTETTGTSDNDVPVTIGLADGDTDEIFSYFLSYFKDDTTKQHIVTAANLRYDKGKLKGKLVDSAKQLRAVLKINGEENIDASHITDDVWDTISKNLITPKALASIMSKRGITKENASTNLWGYNNIGFDVGMINKWLASYVSTTNDQEEIAAAEWLKKVFGASSDAMLKAQEKFKAKRAHGDIKKGESLIQANSSQANSKIAGTTTLQGLTSVITGSKSDTAHEAGSDAANTLDVAAEVMAGKTVDALVAAVEDRIDELDATEKQHRQTTDNGEYFSDAYKAAVLEAFDDSRGIGSSAFNDKTMVASMDSDAAITKQVDDLISQFDAEQVASISGSELRDRYDKRAGRDVSNITGAGANKAGTTRGSLEKLVSTAKAKGYEVAFRKVGDDQIEVALIPSAEYDENNVEFGKEGQIGFNIKVGKNGRIDNGRVNRVSLHTEFVPTGEIDENGKPKTNSFLRLETAETRQIENVIKYLQGDKFDNDGRTPQEASKVMQSLAQNAITQATPAGYLGFSKSEADEYDLDMNALFDEGMSALEATRSTGYNIKDYIEGTLSGTKVKEAIEGFWQAQGQQYKRVDAFNPSRELMMAMIDTFHMAANGYDQKKVDAMPDNSLTKFLLNSDELKFFRRDAATIGKVAPIDYTALSEGRYGVGAVNVTSSRNFTPTGLLYDFTQRGLSQFEGHMPLTQKAKEARKNDTSISREGILTTLQNESAGINVGDAYHRTYTLGTITQEEYNEAQRAYYKKMGLSDDQISLKLQDLQDSILVSQELSEELQSKQLSTSKGTSIDNINYSFLSQLGLDVNALKSNEYEVGASIGLDHTISEGEITGFSKDFQLEFGDRVTGLQKVADGWKLIVERVRDVKAGSKLVTSAGNRLTVQGDAEKLKFVREYIANKRGNDSLMNAEGLMLENEKLEARNYANFFMGQLENILSTAKEEGMSIEEIYKKMIKAFPLLKDMFKISEDGQKIVDKTRFDNETGEIYSINDKGERVNLFGSEGKEEEQAKAASELIGGLDELGKQVLGNDYASIAGLRQLALVQHDVAQYENATGSGNADSIEREGRVRDDFKVRNARIRNRAFFGKYAAQGKDDTDPVVKGLRTLDEELKKENVGSKVAGARASRQQVKEAWHSLKYGDYIQSADTKDIEFITRESLAGSDALENQIIIDDVLTDFNKLRENGTLSQEDYDSFAMEIARKKRDELTKKDAAYKQGNIVLDLSQSKVGGKKFLLGDIGPSKTQEGRLHPSSTDSVNAKLLEAALSTQEEFANASLEAQNAYSYIVDNKDSELYDTATHTYVPNSSFSVAAGGARGVALSAQQANTAQMSSKRFAEHVRSVSGASVNERVENIKKLINQYKVRSKEDYNKLDQAQRDELDKADFSKMDEAALIEFEEKIIQHIINSIKAGNNNYTTEMGRYPYTQGMEGNLMRVGIDDDLGETVKLSQGMLQALRGDTDGDKLRMAMNIAHSTYGEDEFAAEQAILEFYDKFAHIMEQIAQADYKAKNPDVKDREVEINNISKSLNQKMKNDEASLQAKQSFQQIGMFSNSATNVREALAKSGFDGDLSTTEGKTRAFQAGVIRAFLETLEQDAISSKKIQARLMKDGASEEEAYLQVQELTDTLRSGKYSGEDGFIAKAQKLNIWDTLAKGKQVQSLRAQWLAADPEFLKSIDPNLADVNSANAGVTVPMLTNAFSAFENFLKPKGAALKDAFQDTKAIDSKFDVRGNKREDKTYHQSGQNGNNIPPDGPKPPKDGTNIIESGSGITIKTEGPVYVDTTNVVEVKGESTTVNGTLNSSGNNQYSNKQGQQDVASQNVQMRDATGNFIWEAASSVSDPNKITHARDVTVNGVSYGPEVISVTGATKGYHKPESQFDYSGNKVASMGTYSHSMMENMVNNGATVVSELASDIVNAAREEARRPYEQGGAGKDVTQQDFELAERRANQTYAISKQLGIIGDNTLTERNVGFKIGNQVFGGTADALSFSKDEAGNYTGVTVADYKFSQSGGEEDVGQRALRIIQASTYLHGFEIAYQDALEKLRQGEQLDDKFLNNLGILGDNRQSQMADIEAKLKAFENAKIIINRNFVQDGEIYNEIAEGEALSREETAEALERALSGKGLQTERITGASNLQSTYYNASGKMDARPEFVQRRLDAQQGTQYASNKDINSYIKNYKDQLKLQEQIQRAQINSQDKSGEELQSSQYYILAMEKRLNQLKQEAPILDENARTINGIKISEEQLLDIKQKISAANADHLVKEKQIAASQKQQVGFLGKLFGGLKQQMVGFIDTSLAYQAIGQIRSGIRTLINTTKELDAVLVDIQIATGNTREETRALLLNYVDLAKEMGRTTQSVAQASNDWLRAGYEGQEAAELTRASMMLSTLGMIDASEATTYLISTLKGWKISANEVVGVVDKLTVTICGVCLATSIGHGFKCR